MALFRRKDVEKRDVWKKPLASQDFPYSGKQWPMKWIRDVINIMTLPHAFYHIARHWRKRYRGAFFGRSHTFSVMSNYGLNHWRKY